MVTGKLENGFSYIILPNDNPPGRFEAHLEVMSGSVNELERQQGMAHLLEHVAYMGSPKRQLISGTGSRSNAYTDFHHTVFFAACPAETPDQFWKRPMLPMALDALLDVMTTRIDEDRLEKERAAVLSEASMVNKMDYRVECQILSTLHGENRIAQRFPIGKEALIKSWQKEDLELYHSLHYRPDNVVLYVVGDVDAPFAVDQIRKKFGALQPKLDAPRVFAESGEFPAVSMRDVHRHFPPVVHRWSCSEADVRPFVPPALVQPAPSPPTGPGDVSAALQSATKLFQHELLQSFSFHLFAKRPIEPVTSVAAFKRELMRRMVLTTLQIRLNVQQRSQPLFTFAAFNQLNWPREGCAVCSLDITTDTKNWQEAVRLAVREIRRLGLFGLTAGELARYKQATLVEAAQHAAEAGQKANEDVLNELMEAEACGHTFMRPEDALRLTEAVLATLTLDEVNAQCVALCEHLSHLDPARGVQPAAIVACAPTMERSGAAFAVSEADLVAVLRGALLEELAPLADTPVPTTLLPADAVRDKLQREQPRFVPLEGKAQRDEAAAAPPAKAKRGLVGGLLDGVAQAITGAPPAAATPTPAATVGGSTGGVVQRRLSNGIRVNMKPLDAETQRVAVRLYAPGGRVAEDKARPGAVLVGARTMQEGGAFGSMTREQVELFCIDHHVTVEVGAAADAVVFDFDSVTTTPSQEAPPLGAATAAAASTEEVSGVEAVLQVLHVLLTDFLFERDAFERAVQAAHEEFDATVKSLETACQESVAAAITGADPRFLKPNHTALDALTLPQVEAAMRRLLRPENVEVSLAGDLSVAEMEALVLRYLGTVPAAPAAAAQGDPTTPLDTVRPAPGRQLSVFLPDSDERAMGYLAGPAPNRFGVGLPPLSPLSPQPQHPLHAHVALLVLQEIANRRLFWVVREERRLTYDASFQWVHSDGVGGGWFLVSVTASPATVQPAIRACQEALQSLQGAGITGDSLQAAKRTLLQKHRAEASSNRFWLELLAGTQVDRVAAKSLRAMMDFEAVLQGLTAQDLQALADALDFSDEHLTTCVGVAAPAAPSHQQRHQPSDVGAAATTAIA